MKPQKFKNADSNRFCSFPRNRGEEDLTCWNNNLVHLLFSVDGSLASEEEREIRSVYHVFLFLDHLNFYCGEVSNL